jgi:hypothetical protein
MIYLMLSMLAVFGLCYVVYDVVHEVVCSQDRRRTMRSVEQFRRARG